MTSGLKKKTLQGKYINAFHISGLIIYTFLNGTIFKATSIHTWDMPWDRVHTVMYIHVYRYTALELVDPEMCVCVWVWVCVCVCVSVQCWLPHPPLVQIKSQTSCSLWVEVQVSQNSLFMKSRTHAWSNATQRHRYCVCLLSSKNSCHWQLLWAI